MRILMSAGCFGLIFASSAFALDPATTRQLKALTPSERLEQRCDMEAMSRIGKEKRGLSPDKVIAYTFGKTLADGSHLRAPGAVVRSKGAWYRLKYDCVATNGNLDIKSFSYQVGAEVPKASWGKYYLYD
ncbi:DUF930 domain-containing protein [Rhizobium paknamense]|uniref:DUF930 domain-containing protein n=1 Tax=Rhizobium paknamense TaxID=1206817 RepID=A0ABU0I7Z2_9HYPH|nr:DUF930 domain-containing protein [Rhizobium paknamense]MDQ0454354.1 hypothetical protein [Rhizobium paknamense]